MNDKKPHPIKIRNQSYVKHYNIQTVLRVLEEFQPVSRTEMVKLTGATTGKTGTASVKLTGADLSVYVGEGEAFVAAVMGTVEVKTEINYSIYDVNQDGKVDQLDITRAQRCYGKNAGDEGWNTLADVNKDGTVDINDLILILNNYSKK